MSAAGRPAGGTAMRAEGRWLVDVYGRRLILRGANLGGSSKLPCRPDGATHNPAALAAARDVSFVGRPFPLAEADEHFARLRAWGLTAVRLVTTWEAVEHAGPGCYDAAYLDHLHAIAGRAAEHGIRLIIDMHQDVWSRFTGGDGAPGWTLEAVGMDLSRLVETGAALTHAAYGDPFPRALWQTNYGRLGAATMFTLFFAGDDFAPRTTVDGEPVAAYLQRHFIGAVRQIALRLRDLPNVIGYDTLNEPSAGYIGLRDLAAELPGPFRMGLRPTPFQGMLLASGYPQEVPEYRASIPISRRVCVVRLNEQGVSLWRAGCECVWKQNGVWTDRGGPPRLLRRDHFASVRGRRPDFTDDYLKPFITRLAAEIRAVHPGALIFAEGLPMGRQPRWAPGELPGLVNAAHWYDGVTLVTGRYRRWLTWDTTTGVPALGPGNVRRSFARQLARLRRAAEQMGGVPTVIGEFGLPFDLEEGRAYRTGDFSTHVEALNAYYDAMDRLLLSCLIWNYTADNTNARGDGWNGEDFSIFSRDQATDPGDINSGGRALAGFVRPYACAVAGEPTRMRFDLATRVFELEYRHDPAVRAPTEIFLPRLHYPDGFRVALSDGRWESNAAAQTLTVWQPEARPVHWVRVQPPRD